MSGTASIILANAVGSDGRSRLRYKPSGGSERFHALHPKPPIGCHNGVFACDQHNLMPGDRPLPAHTIAKDLRCNRAACKKLFDLADAAALNT